MCLPDEGSLGPDSEARDTGIAVKGCANRCAHRPLLFSVPATISLTSLADTLLNADSSTNMDQSGSKAQCARRLRAALASAEPPLRTISEAESARRPAPGKWSPRQVIGHLIDSASNNHQRFVRAIWQDELVFPGYDQERWVEVQRYQDASWRELLDLLGAFNRHIARVLSAIPDDVRLRIHARQNLDEIAMHAPAHAGQATLDYFMSDYVDHLEHHIRQIPGAGWTVEE